MTRMGAKGDIGGLVGEEEGVGRGKTVVVAVL